MLVIGLGHRKRVGKDTLAAGIIGSRSLRYNIRRIAYADALKNELTAAFVDLFPNSRNPGVDSEAVLRGKWTQFCRHFGIQLTRPVDVEFGTDLLCPYGKCRQAAQWWGTEFKRAIDPNYWTNKMEEAICRAAFDRVDAVLITDMRFPNEAEQIELAAAWGDEYGHLLAGERWKIERIYPEGEEPPYDPHPSEHALDNHTFDKTIAGRTIEETLEAGLREFDSLIGEHFASIRNRLRDNGAEPGE